MPALAGCEHVAVRVAAPAAPAAPQPAPLLLCERGPLQRAELALAAGRSASARSCERGVPPVELVGVSGALGRGPSLVRAPASSELAPRGLAPAASPPSTIHLPCRSTWEPLQRARAKPW